MRFRATILTLLLVLANLYSQNNKYSTFYYQRASLFEALPIDTTDIVFLGNSITNGAEWHELFNNPNIKNRGISGDICEGVFDRLDAITNGMPSKIFLMIGINDVARGTTLDSIFSGIEKIVDKIQKDSPITKIYVQSVLPLNDETGMFGGHTKRYLEIPCLNSKLEKLSIEKDVTYIDLFSHLTIPNTSKIDLKYSNDGLHLLGAGYLKWVDVLRPYIEE